MAFVLFGSFIGYSCWENKIIEICMTFYKKYQRFPNYIRMKETTMDSLFEELDLKAEAPEEHAVKDSDGNLLFPVQIKDGDSWDDYEMDNYESQSETDVIYPFLGNPQLLSITPGDFNSAKRLIERLNKRAGKTLQGYQKTIARLLAEC